MKCSENSSWFPANSFVWNVKVIDVNFAKKSSPSRYGRYKWNRCKIFSATDEKLPDISAIFFQFLHSLVSRWQRFKSLLTLLRPADTVEQPKIGAVLTFSWVFLQCDLISAQWGCLTQKMVLVWKQTSDLIVCSFIV